MHANPHTNVERYFPISSGNLPRVAPHVGPPSLAAPFNETSSTTANEEEETKEVEDEGQGGKREGDEEVVEEEDVVWLLGRAHDGPLTRETEG